MSQAEHLHPCYFCWLAGFIDGEGCFFIGHRRAGGSYHTTMLLQVRVDEKPTLDEIIRRTGIGSVRCIRPSAGARAAYPGTREQVLWQVSSKRDCARLVALLEQHPQHAKKRRDFEIWAQALRRWQTKRYRNDRANDWSDMASLKQELEAVRSVGLDGSEPTADAAEAEHQLLLSDPDGNPA